MKSPLQNTVHAMLATYLDADARTIDDAQRLEDDLGLDPLDLILVALHLEELVPGRDLPLARLEETRTVGDLVWLFESAWERDTLVEVVATGAPS